MCKVAPFDGNYINESNVKIIGNSDILLFVLRAIVYVSYKKLIRNPIKIKNKKFCGSRNCYQYWVGKYIIIVMLIKSKINKNLENFFWFLLFYEIVASFCWWISSK